MSKLIIVPTLLTLGALGSVTTACRSGNDARPASPASRDAMTSSAAPTSRDTVVARLDGETINAGEMDDRVKGGLIRAEVEYRESSHKLRSGALDDIINERLVAKKAKAEGLTADAYMQREVKARVTPPSDEELRALYDQAKAAGQQLPPFDVVKPQIVRYVADQKAQEAVADIHGKLRSEAKLETLLPPLELPRIPVDTNGPTLGKPESPVTIVVFSDYECPYCKQAEPALKQIVQAYDGKVKLVFREFPLPSHPHAQKASEAALCAHDQGKYWQMSEKMFENQRGLEVASLKEYARGIGLDQASFDKCLDDGAKGKEVAASLKAGEDAGVAGTPSLFINGRPITGAASYDNLKELVDAELASTAK